MASRSKIFRYTKLSAYLFSDKPSPVFTFFAGKKKQRAAIGLIEIMLVLALTALIFVMSVRYYSSAVGSEKINETANIVGEVLSAIENYLNNTGNCQFELQNEVCPPSKGTSIDIVYLTEQGYLPNSYVITTTDPSTQKTTTVAASNPFGGDTTFNFNTSDFITIQETGLPVDVCTIIAGRLTSTMNTSLGESASCSSSAGAQTLSVKYAM